MDLPHDLHDPRGSGMAPRVGKKWLSSVGHRHDEIEGALYLKEYLRKAVDCTKADSIVTEGFWVQMYPASSLMLSAV